jgi:hypothetical protein
MKNQWTYNLTIFFLLLIPSFSFGQAPDLGAAASFALFTSVGAFGNTGTSFIIGDIGSNSASVTGFPPGTIIGTIYNPPNTTLAQAALDVDDAYSDLFGRTCGATLGTPFGNGQILTPGIYCQGSAATLNGDLTLDGGGNPNALFIIQIDGALTIGAFSTVTLINSASLCNVYWQINGQFDLGDGSVFRGTAIVNGAIHLLGNSSLFGRGLSRTGAISLANNIVRFVPAAAEAIVGTTPVCQGETGVAYSVPAITDAESYSWTLPTGATIATGANTNSITVDYSNSAASGDITVSGNNSCGGNGTSSSLAITVDALPATSAIYHE